MLQKSQFPQVIRGNMFKNLQFPIGSTETGKAWSEQQYDLLERFVDILKKNQGHDPKCEIVIKCLRERGWLERGCIVFSQYRD